MDRDTWDVTDMDVMVKRLKVKELKRETWKVHKNIPLEIRTVYPPQLKSYS